MTTRRHAATLALLLLALAPGVAARDRDDVATPPKPTGPQEVEVMAVAVDQETQVPVIVLQGKRDRRTLAMSIDPAQALGIAAPLNGVTPSRPLTHDLFLTIFDRLNVTVTRAVITDFRDDIYYATLYLAAPGAPLALDARPSDAIALAIRAKAPVFVEDRVFDKTSTPALLRRRPSI
ncbi:MAG TPA: bifunctional nuclease family protein [Methylomirabilota bacterium]|jgi:hypothetical protein